MTNKQEKNIILPENVPINENFERMLKNFLKEVDKSGIIREIRENRYYKKPSQIRREKSKEVKKRR